MTLGALEAFGQEITNLGTERSILCILGINGIIQISRSFLITGSPQISPGSLRKLTIPIGMSIILKM